jgi:hypothetical protein
LFLNLIPTNFEEYNQHENAYFTEGSEADATLKKRRLLLMPKYATAILF